jgi:uncharacterized alpha/beta hydrolase family protein
MKIALIVVSVLLVAVVIYFYLSRKQASADSSKTTIIPRAVPTVTRQIPPTVYIEPTSGTVSSNPRPIATVISNAATTASGGGAASVVAVVLNPALLLNCRIRCAATYPANRTKREACQANCG